ncbi:tRNA (cytidine/uridine-2'-O-)-methyltransferase [Thiogranum longum]|uniref:tRNA (cytidine(34)-2'-O)-methyltransferase n=1 Tax=Thiogranum longum TaxID=1537524 RepID=A0A4R1H8T0_9GAMM|nr:tRNA (uridine(34)/cytosine(34)/5-carboxymethylaminomethyluridine(34)-2'-O)-methyltransferase TrmL [Thiogranum longum]TCK16853.1 tRNA (cytidine/uridine-2'-O-)-methyltransferase [Thiogranum longum]
MFHIVLYQPEIPPNTGNVMRLCANTGCSLHLIRPLGFELDDRKLRRAGLDYREWASVQVHDTLQGFITDIQPKNLYAVSTRGTRRYCDINYQPGDALLFGPETRGLPVGLLESQQVSTVIRLPMVARSRSLNLSNTVAVLVYEAWRQQAFSGAD